MSVTLACVYSDHEDCDRFWCDCSCHEEPSAPLRQVGWLGPYGLIPGGMDNDPVPNWRPVYVQEQQT
jgi:hypothetical protein